MMENSSQSIGYHIEQKCSQPKISFFLKAPKPSIKSQNPILNDEPDKYEFF